MKVQRRTNLAVLDRAEPDDEADVTIENGRHPVIERMHVWFAALDHDFTVRAEVEKFIASEKEQHTKEFVELAEAMVEAFLIRRAGDYLRRLRAAARKKALRERVGNTLSPLSPQLDRDATAKVAGTYTLFARQFVINDENVRRAVADMNGPDHLYVAHGYEASSVRSKLEASFHKAVAKKIGAGQTKDFYTEQQYEAMYRSIVGT